METYESILSRMTEKYSELSGNEPHDASDIAIRLRLLAGEIYSSLVYADWLKRQMFADTAEGQYLDYHAHTRGLSRRESSVAVGEVVFSVSEPVVADLTIPAGTVLSTSGESPLQFETTETVVIPAGYTSAHAKAQAISHGRAYNAAAETVNVMVTPPTGVEKVRNPDPFVGGTDAESDSMLRSRVIDSYTNASNGTNCAYYKSVAMEVPGVASAGVVPKGRGVGTVDVYVSGEGTEVSEELIEQVQALLSQLREVNVDVKVMQAESVYTDFVMRLDVKDGYEFEDIKDKCICALDDYVASVGVGESVLLTEAGERIYHIEGVKEYWFTPSLNRDVRLQENQYPIVGSIVITQGVVK